MGVILKLALPGRNKMLEMANDDEHNGI